MVRLPADRVATAGVSHAGDPLHQNPWTGLQQTCHGANQVLFSWGGGGYFYKNTGALVLLLLFIAAPRLKGGRGEIPKEFFPGFSNR